LPFAYDPDLYQPRALSREERAQWGNALAFVGTWERAREERLNAVADFDLGIWGNHWSRLAPGSTLRRLWRGEAHGEKLSRIYSASSIALNFVREQNGPAHNMRTFEAPACGILMLTSRTKEQVELFGEDDGAAFFDSGDEMRDKVRYYLAQPEQHERVARTGLAKIARGHTYADRMAQVLRDFDRKRH
jgi:spore maturation protein CgeB